MLKMALFDCGITMKNVAALTEDGAFALFVRPHPGGFDSSGVPTPGNLPSKAKKIANAWGSAWGGCWAQVELTGALEISSSLMLFLLGHPFNPNDYRKLSDQVSPLLRS